MVLYESNDDTDDKDFDSTLMIIPFIQLFDNLQRELLKEGINKESIVKQFEQYPKYLELVSHQYHEFCK